MRILVLLLFFSLSPEALAGRWGIAGGLNYNNVQNNNPPPFDGNLNSGFGFQLGALYFEEFETWNLRPMAQLRTLRANLNEQGQDIEISNIYLALPIIFEWPMGKWFKLYAGPEIDLLIRERTELDKAEIDGGFEELYMAAVFGPSFRLTKRLYVELYAHIPVTSFASNMDAQIFGVQFVSYFGKR